MTCFHYHRSLTPMMAVLVALVLVEATALHLLPALWWPALSVALSIVSVAALVWLLLLIRSFRRLPVVLEDADLVWRCGTLRGLTIPVSQIAGVRTKWTLALIKDRETLNCALIAWPNVVLDLAEPIKMGRRRISRLAHRLDDQEAFIAALERLRADP
ncbi:hypothetical protein [Sphingobium sp. CR28]|uniref:hypothetical protein n=1 Tax=Sphingobium sp. CR28 TaxID=3400272 RepID=UPI003FF06465